MINLFPWVYNYTWYHGAWADQRLATVLQISCIPGLQMVCNTVMSLIKNSMESRARRYRTTS